MISLLIIKPFIILSVFTSSLLKKIEDKNRKLTLFMRGLVHFIYVFLNSILFGLFFLLFLAPIILIVFLLFTNQILNLNNLVVISSSILMFIMLSYPILENLNNYEFNLPKKLLKYFLVMMFVLETKEFRKTSIKILFLTLVFTSILTVLIFNAITIKGNILFIILGIFIFSLIISLCLYNSFKPDSILKDLRRFVKWLLAGIIFISISLYRYSIIFIQNQEDVSSLLDGGILILSLYFSIKVIPKSLKKLYKTYHSTFPEIVNSIWVEWYSTYSVSVLVKKLKNEKNKVLEEMRKVTSNLEEGKTDILKKKIVGVLIGGLFIGIIISIGFNMEAFEKLYSTLSNKLWELWILIPIFNGNKETAGVSLFIVFLTVAFVINLRKLLINGDSYSFEEKDELIEWLILILVLLFLAVGSLFDNTIFMYIGLTFYLIQFVFFDKNK